MIRIKKDVRKAFGKKIYLLGVDKDKVKHWLEAPSWDCKWYWGFGYIETYTNNNSPENSKDISSHSHWDTSITGKINGTYISHLNEHPNFKETVLTDDESWKLAELMRSFYVLKDTAELLKSGCAGLTDNPAKDTIKDLNFRDKINNIMLPSIFNKIIELLSNEK